MNISYFILLVFITIIVLLFLFYPIDSFCGADTPAGLWYKSLADKGWGFIDSAGNYHEYYYYPAVKTISVPAIPKCGICVDQLGVGTPIPTREYARYLDNRVGPVIAAPTKTIKTLDPETNVQFSMNDFQHQQDLANYIFSGDIKYPTNPNACRKKFIKPL